MAVIDGEGRGWTVDPKTGEVVEFTPTRALNRAIHIVNAARTDATARGDHAEAIELGIALGQAAVMQVLGLPDTFPPTPISQEKAVFQQRIDIARTAYEQAVAETKRLESTGRGILSDESIQREILERQALGAWGALQAEYWRRFGF